MSRVTPDFRHLTEDSGKLESGETNMGNLSLSRTAIVAMLALTGTACRRGEESKPLAALDSAYQAGVITKSEYDAKKTALASLAALDKARDAGLLTPVEYQERKQRLTAT